MSTQAFVSSKIRSAPVRTEFGSDVRQGLTRSGQKELHSKYFYDDLGTTLLFQAITLLPEYGLTRADTRILRTSCAGDRRAGGAAGTDRGIGERNRREDPLHSGSDAGPSRPIPLLPHRRVPGGLASLRARTRSVAPKCVQSWDRIFPASAPRPNLRTPGEHLLVLFLGSTLGNFELQCAREFLKELRGLLQPGDCLLLGVDLVKPVPQLLAAYDDALGSPPPSTSTSFPRQRRTRREFRSSPVPARSSVQ
jgi:L-histidine N-alpha-methyltransferase